MAGWRVALIAALLGVAALGAQARQLRADAPAAWEDRCTRRWAATLDAELANTLASGPEGAGRVTIQLTEASVLEYTTSLGGNLQLAALALRVEDLEGGSFRVPLVPQAAASAVAGALRSAAAAMLVGGAAATVEATTSAGERLVGALASACPTQQPEPLEEAAWSAGEPRLPACELPGFQQRYTIPAEAACPGFERRVSQAAGVQLEDILLASAHDASGRVLSGPRLALCLPTGSPDPCGPEFAAQPEQPAAWERAAYGYEQALCDQPGFEQLYPVSPACDGISQRLREACGLDVEAVVEASWQLLSQGGGGLCLPAGCDPCSTAEAEAAAELERALAAAAPNCANTYHFTQAFEVPRACNLAEALRAECGLEPEAVAAASGLQLLPDYAGFGPGKTVCLPEACRPCQQPQPQQALPIATA